MSRRRQALEEHRRAEVEIKAVLDQERAYRYANWQIDGMTLDAIGKIEGVTRERIRQVVADAGLAEDVRQLKGMVTAAQAARAARQAAALRKFTVTDMSGRKAAVRQWTDGDIVAAVSEWLDEGGDGTAPGWIEDKRSPSSALICIRIGWAKAVALAEGLEPEQKTWRRIDYISENACRQSIVDFLLDPSVVTGSSGEYDRWAKRHRRVGSQTIRHRFDTWYEAKSQALEAISPMSVEDLDWDVAEEYYRRLVMQQYRAEVRAEFFRQSDAKWAESLAGLTGIVPAGGRNLGVSAVILADGDFDHTTDGDRGRIAV